MRVTRNEDLRTVIEIACETQHRTDREQRALIALAWECDKANNRHTATNTAARRDGWKPSNLVALVMATRWLSEGDRDVPAPNRWAETWHRWDEEMPAWLKAIR